MPAVDVTIPLQVTAKMRLRLDASSYDAMSVDELHELARDRVREAINAIGTDEIPVRCQGSIFIEIDGPVLTEISIDDPRR
jgi:hypothetical protein